MFFLCNNSYIYIKKKKRKKIEIQVWKQQGAENKFAYSYCLLFIYVKGWNWTANATPTRLSIINPRCIFIVVAVFGRTVWMNVFHYARSSLWIYTEDVRIEICCIGWSSSFLCSSSIQSIRRDKKIRWGEKWKVEFMERVFKRGYVVGG